MILFWLSILATIPLAILSNFLTPKVVRWFTIRHSKLKKRRAASLKKEFKYICSCHDSSPSESAALAAHLVLNSVMDFAFAIIANAFYLAAYTKFIKVEPTFSDTLAIVSVAAFFLAIYRISRTRRLLRNIYHFDKYEHQTQLELQQLTGSIEEFNSDTNLVSA